MMDKQCCDIYQMDPAWTGGVSDAMKIWTLASTYDAPLIPHGTVQQVNVQLSFAQNAVMAPMVEDLVGIGLDIHESKIESERILSWA